MNQAKWRILFLSVSSACLIALLTCRGGATEPAAADNSELHAPQGRLEAVCSQAGGVWRQFPNSCGDQCAYVRDPAAMMCAQALTLSCDCGPDRCFTGRFCERN